MSGELTGETAGTATSIKVMTAPHGAPMMETTVEAHGTVLGLKSLTSGRTGTAPA